MSLSKKKNQQSWKQEDMTGNEEKNKLVETEQEITDKRNKQSQLHLLKYIYIYIFKCILEKLEESMNTMRRTMEDIKIYLGLLKMKITLYGINSRICPAKENITEFEDMKRNYPK